jgi:hypothetical protein
MKSRWLQKKWMAWMSVMAVLIVMTACGGGGGGGGNSTSDGGGEDVVDAGEDPVDDGSGPFTVADLTGAYRGGSIGFDGSDGWAGAMDLTFDGAGAFSGEDVFTADLFSGSYAVSSLGVLTADTEVGQLSDGGDVFHSIQTDASNPIFSIGLKKSTGRTAADMVGTYHVFFASELGLNCRVERYEFVFNGIDTISYASMSAPGFAGDISYAVEDDGVLRIGSGNFGQTSIEGDIFFVVNPGDDLMVGVKQASGVLDADLVGTYHAIFLADDDRTVDGVSTGRLTISSDGSGDVTVTPIDPVGTVATLSGSVGDNGSLTGYDDMVGQLSPNAELFVIADDGSVDGDDDYQLIIGILMP